MKKNKNDNREKNNKRGFPSLLLIFIVTVVVMLVIQNFTESKRANIAFNHQLEHLENLQLIEPEKSRKTSANNDNLVNFTGSFRDNLTEEGKNRYRFLQLLAQHNDLQGEMTDLHKDLEVLHAKAYQSALYFYQITGFPLPASGYVVIPKSFDRNDISYHIILRDISVKSPGNLRSLQEQFRYLSQDNAALYAFGNRLEKLIQEFKSTELGIGSESIKSSLRQVDQSVKAALLDRSMNLDRKMKVFGLALQELQDIAEHLQQYQGEVGLYGLRSVRNYLEYLEVYQGVAANYEKNLVALGKARSKVAHVPWFFNDKEISTKALEEESAENYGPWFHRAQEEWQGFDKNKGLSFKAVDQRRNSVLEKSFKSEEPATNYLSYLITFLPIILIGFLFYFMFARQAKGMGSSAMHFGKSPAKLLKGGNQKITFEDVAGIEEAKEELEEIVDFLKDPMRYRKLGARIPKGVLLVGNPGTGKTLIGKAVAGEAGVPFFSISGSDFVEMFVGVGASRVRDLFDQARKSSPCIIFIDEIDAVGRTRGSGLGGGHDEREQTLNQLLVEIDGIDSTTGVIIVAATNRPDVLDKALLRPGRFDRSVYVNLPDTKGRLAILKVHAKKVKLGDKVNLKDIAKRTTGMSGAELENILNEAALIAARKRRKAVNQDDLVFAFEKVAYGKERRSLEVNKEDMETTAYHEAGHTIVALILNDTDELTKVTRIPRGESAGATHFAKKPQRMGYREKELKIKIAITMGGRVAEEIVNDKDPSTGPYGDIKQATSIARAMVTQYGMSEELGLVDLSEGGQDKSLISGFHEKDHSEETARLIDKEVKRLVDEGYAKARQVIEENDEKFREIALMLIEFETLDKSDLDAIMAGTFSKDEKHKQIEMESDKAQRTPPPPPPTETKGKKGFLNNQENPDMA